MASFSLGGGRGGLADAEHAKRGLPFTPVRQASRPRPSRRLARKRECPRFATGDAHQRSHIDIPPCRRAGTTTAFDQDWGHAIAPAFALKHSTGLDADRYGLAAHAAHAQRISLRADTSSPGTKRRLSARIWGRAEAKHPNQAIGSERAISIAASIVATITERWRAGQSTT